MAVVFPMKLGFKRASVWVGVAAAASKIAFSDGLQKCKEIAAARQTGAMERPGVWGESAAILDIALCVLAARPGISSRGRRCRLQGDGRQRRRHRQRRRLRQDEGD